MGGERESLALSRPLASLTRRQTTANNPNKLGRQAGKGKRGREKPGGWEGEGPGMGVGGGREKDKCTPEERGWWL